MLGAEAAIAVAINLLDVNAVDSHILSTEVSTPLTIKELIAFKDLQLLNVYAAFVTDSSKIIVPRLDNLVQS
jgi:hypothetical protein